jgi:hypothetical protein
MTGETIWDLVLGWVIRAAGLFWLIGSFMLFRQIRLEMALDRMSSKLGAITRDLEAEAASDGHAGIDASPEQQAVDLWTDRDDAARRGWIAGQAVVLAITGLAMLILHPLASGFVALLVLGQGIYFIWRETTARRAPTAEAARHARPSPSTINAGWVCLFVACLVWMAAFRGVLH